MPTPQLTVGLAGHVRESTVAVWEHFIKIVGIGGAIALYLTYTLAQTLPAMRDEMVSLKAQETIALGLIREQLSKTQDVYRLGQINCAHMAKGNVEEIRECLAGK